MNSSIANKNKIYIDNYLLFGLLSKILLSKYFIIFKYVIIVNQLVVKLDDDDGGGGVFNINI
jgi:hypothetical protein